MGWCWALIVVLSLLTLLALVERLRVAIPHNPLVAYGTTAVLRICLSNIKIVHQFSSRLIASALPFMILVAAFSATETPIRAGVPGEWRSGVQVAGYVWRFAAGLTLSVLLVLNYYRVIDW